MANRTDGAELIFDLNFHKLLLLIPVIVFVSVLMIIGSFGNIMVCVFYGCKSKLCTNSFFIVTLAVFDLILCLILIPLDIVDLRFSYIFTNIVACKFLRLLNYIATYGSAITLLAIAVDRYNRICKPLYPQLDIKRAILAVCVSSAIAVLISWPAAVLYEPVEVNVSHVHNGSYKVLKGMVCTTTKDGSYEKYIWAFHIIHFLMFAVAVVILCVLYSLVGRAIYRYRKRQLKYTSDNGTSNRAQLKTSFGKQKEVLSGVAETNISTIDNVAMRPISVDTSGVNNEEFRKHGSKPTTVHTDSIKTSTSMKSNAESKETTERPINKVVVKSTILMLAITAVFVLSYLPHLSLVIWRSFQADNQEELGDSELWFQLGLRSFFLNSAINPILYGFFNEKFRTFFRATFGYCCNNEQ